ncbi:hypothetical protein ACFV0Y_07445 [Streptomyces sp. NPDC059569]|uniref:hypothetical protein n=1 Tax=Streptomyces sp. NPDC059569 TaxID=3346869 RepID=UPI0036B79688
MGEGDHSVAAGWLAPAYGGVGIGGVVVTTDGRRMRCCPTGTAPPGRLRLVAPTTSLASAARQLVGRDLVPASGDHGRYRHPVRDPRARDDLAAGDVPLLDVSGPWP